MPNSRCAVCVADRSGPNGVFNGYIKGLYSNSVTGAGFGQFVGYDSDWQGGVNGIEVGDGYHNYLVVGIVSCNCAGLIDPGRRITAAALSLKTSRVYGKNPFTAFPADLYTDMVT